ncbi:MAG: LptF/LptG family permease [Akkermansiaceae bacterium]
MKRKKAHRNVWLGGQITLAFRTLEIRQRLQRLFPAIALAIAGAGLAVLLAPLEKAAVEDHLLGFPDADSFAHELRPLVLTGLCFLPALGAFYYAMVRSLDRYLIRQFLSSFLLCFLTLYVIWTLLDLTDNMGDFRNSGNTGALMTRYYGMLFPLVFVELAPFALLLGLLYALGKMSRSQEIVAMIQTGRGVVRLILPFAMVGGVASLFCLGFNYQWAPWADGYKEALVEQAREGSTSQARNVVYFHKEGRRIWFVGSFPFHFNKGQPLKNVIVHSFDEEGRPKLRLQAAEARWNKGTRGWNFSEVELLHLDRRVGGDGPLMPEYELPEGDLQYTDWNELPWKIIKPGLPAENLGIPDLYSWLRLNQNEEWANKRRFLTQWHYRWAQPGICLALVLLAAPLGIVFSRRGAAGGVALAIFLSAGMMFASTVFLSLGEAGHIPPIWAAWGTNILTVGLALILIQRRLVGRPIYHSLKKLLPF